MAAIDPFRTKPVRVSDMNVDDDDQIEKGGLTFPPAGTKSTTPELDGEVRVLEEHMVERKLGLLERMLLKNQRAEELKPIEPPAPVPRETPKPGDGTKILDVRETSSTTPSPAPSAKPEPVPPSPWNSKASEPIPTAMPAPAPQAPGTAPVSQPAAAPIAPVPVPVGMLPEPVRETPPAPAAPQTAPAVQEIPHNTTADPAPTAGLNLAALRERVLHESSSPTFHAEARTAQTAPVVAGLAAERKAKLAGMDLHALGDLHETPAAGPTFAELAQLAEGGTIKKDTESAPQTAPITESQTPPLDTGVSPVAPTPASTPAPEPVHMMPQTTHAAGIAQVAENLRRIEAGESLQETSAASHLPKTPASIPTMRTYRGDMEHTMMHDQTSVVQAIAAEEVRRTANTNPLVGGRPSMFSPGAYLLIGMSIVLVVLGVAGGGVYLFMQSRSTTVVATDTLPTFFFTERQQELEITDKSRQDIVNRLMYIRDGVNVQVGAMTLVYLTHMPTGEASARKRLVTAQEYLTALELGAPATLARTIQDQMMLGVHEFGKNEPFIVFKVGDYRAAYAGMLAWERTLNIDLAPLFGDILPSESFQQAGPALATPVASSSATTSASTTKSNTASSTPPVPTPGMRTFGFADEIISNKEVRALRNAAGEMVLLWSFPDSETLVITTNKNTYAEILTRMSARRF